jgi:hypothetical protein
MPIPELILAVAASAVKTAMKIWLKDNEFAADTGATVADYVSKKVGDGIGQRDVVRLFQDLEIPIAEKLLTSAAVEYQMLPEGERSLAITVAARILDTARYSDQDLFSMDLDPLFLKKHILKSADPSWGRDLSSDGELFLQRILSECCLYIVETTKVLPTFYGGAFTELLRRVSALKYGQASLAEQLDEVLIRLPLPGGTDGEDVTDDQKFAGVYAAQVRRMLDTMELFGVSVKMAKYQLSSAYVGIDLVVPSFAALDNGAAMRVAGGQPIESVLPTRRRLFLRAPAGAGKTTLLHWLAVRSAWGDFAGNLAPLNLYTPFYVPLRLYAETDLPGPAEFVRQVGRHIGDQMPKGWVERQLADGRAIVLIDGVDELPEERRPSVRTWLRTLILDYPDVRYVITSRPEATEEHWLKSDGFVTGELLSLTERGIRELIQRWHDSAVTDIADIDERERVAALAAGLTDTILMQRHLRSIAATPLMCALLCALNRDRRVVPKDRIEIYRSAVEMLIKRRDENRGVSTDDINLSTQQKTEILQDLAYWMLRNRLLSVSVSRVVDRIEHKFGSLAGVTSGSRGVYKHLAVRSGLLYEPRVGEVAFVHRTLEDYLAAQAIIDNDDVELLVSNAGDDYWQDVVVSAAGYAKGVMRSKLFTLLLASRPADPADDRKVGLVTIACLETAASVEPDIQAEIESRAAGLVPPSDMSEAAALALAGNIVLDALSERIPSDPRRLSACIRTARLIGSEDALRFIEQFRDDSREAVRNELVSAWESFDPVDYAHRILATYTQISLSNPSLLAGLTEMRELIDLRVDIPGIGAKMEFIQVLPWIRRLGVIDTSTTLDLAPLAGHVSLEDVGLDVAGLSNLDRLPSIPNLEVLSLRKVYFGTDLSPIADCVNLVSLRLVGDVDLSPLGALTNLAIEIDGTVRGAERLKSSVTLDLSENSRQVGEREPSRENYGWNAI